MNSFLEMRTFVAVVEATSFIRAADVLGLSKAAVSRHVQDMEERLGVRLLQRTTRRLSLTEEGQVFYERAKELLSDLEEAEAEITSRGVSAKGLLRVNAPVTFGVQKLAPLWGKFLQQNPEIILDVTLSDRIVDLIEEGYDLAIRIANLASSSLISRKLGATRMILCAAPTYLKKHGKPRSPADLKKHSTISYRYWSTKDEWHFVGPKGGLSVKTKPRMHTNSGDTCRLAALSGQGIILQPSFLVQDDIKKGRLIEILPKYRAFEIGIYAVYPARQHVSPKVRALVDFLVREKVAG